MKQYFKKNYLLYKDSIIATAITVLLAILLKQFPLNSHLFDPISHTFKDFEFSDLLYSKFHGTISETDANIVLVDIANLERPQIAHLIKEIQKNNPKVIGLDVIFKDSKGAEKDSFLISVLNDQSIVFGSYISNYNKEQKCFSDISRTGIVNIENNIEGYTNFVAEKFSTVRFFEPTECIDDRQMLSFPAAIVKQFNISAFEKLQSRGNKSELIDYIGDESSFRVLSSADVFNHNIDFIRGKIIILGLLSQDQNTKLFEDLHYTPLNKKYSGKTLPDMYGAVIHANIISMILKENYVNQYSFLEFIFAVLIGFAHMVLFTHYFADHHRHKWFHLVAKTAQLFTSILFLFLSLLLLAQFNIKIDVSLTILVIVLSVDLLYFYEAFVRFIHEKYNYKTIHAHD